MSVIINTNINSLINLNILNKHTNSISRIFERLSTGSRINHAIDDAAGTAISASLTNKISSSNIVKGNIQTSISMISTADDTYSDISDILTRVRDLSLSALNGTYSLDERKALQKEADALISETYRIKSTAKFSDRYILGPESPPEDDAKAESAADIQAAREAELINQGYIPVSTAQDLHDALELNNPDCKVVLCADIDLNDLIDETGSNWSAVGTYISASDYSAAFKGTLDGNGHTISNLKINKATTNYQGLFGCTYGATIKNLYLENVDVTGQRFTGGLVGTSQANSAIENCSVSGNVKGTRYTGGLVGDNDGSTINNCSSSGNVTGTDIQTGGLVAVNHNGAKINNCASSSNVTGTKCTGGLVGDNDGSIINNCASSGNVTGSDMQTGGFVGLNYNGAKINNCSSSGNANGTKCTGGFVGDNDSATINNCTSSGNATGTNVQTGGFVGLNYNGAEINNCTSSGNASGTGYVGGFAGISQGSTIQYSATISTAEGVSYVGSFLGGFISGTISTNEYNPEVNIGMNPIGGTAATEEQVKENTSLDINNPTVSTGPIGPSGQIGPPGPPITPTPSDKI